MAPLQKQFACLTTEPALLRADTSASGLRAHREMAVPECDRATPTPRESLPNGITLSAFGDGASESPGKLTKDQEDGASTLFLLNIRAFSK